jgi:hypothetical protein
MKKVLTIVVVAGLGIVLYNQYKKSKDTKVKLK